MIASQGGIRLAPVIALLAAVGLASCTASPLYAPSAGAPSVAVELAAIRILPATDRLTEVVRNELDFAFTGGGAASTARYELSLSASAAADPVPVIGTTRRVTVRVRYTLLDLVTGLAVTGGEATGSAEYEYLNQAFANLQAEQDAQERAARGAATEVRTALSIALAR